MQTVSLPASGTAAGTSGTTGTIVSGNGTWQLASVAGSGSGVRLVNGPFWYMTTTSKWAVAAKFCLPAVDTQYIGMIGTSTGISGQSMGFGHLGGVTDGTNIGLMYGGGGTPFALSTGTLINTTIPVNTGTWLSLIMYSPGDGSLRLRQSGAVADAASGEVLSSGPTTKHAPFHVMHNCGTTASAKIMYIDWFAILSEVP